MVYLHFPSNLTEEELMLQAKYQKLKKKKKALQALKAPKQEPEKPILPKRPTEARDAREIARKLIKSGAIQPIKSPPPQPQNATFKRPRAESLHYCKHTRKISTCGNAYFLRKKLLKINYFYNIYVNPYHRTTDYIEFSPLNVRFPYRRERKLSGSAGATGGVASYQPFSASQEPPPPEEKPSPRVKYLYDSFVTARDKEEKGVRNQSGGDTSNPSGGKSCTLQLTGANITEEVIRRRLTTFEPFTFTLEDEEKAFLTFETPDMASHALSALEESEENWRVTLTRRPPSGSWTPSTAPRNAQPAKDTKRTILTYDDIFD